MKLSLEWTGPSRYDAYHLKAGRLDLGYVYPSLVGKWQAIADLRRSPCPALPCLARPDQTRPGRTVPDRTLPQQANCRTKGSQCQ